MAEHFEDKDHAEKMDAAGRPSLKSLIIYFLPLSPMNELQPQMWLVGYLPAILSYLFYYSSGAAPHALLKMYLLGAAAGDPTLDGRPAWLQALDFGERVVLLTIHLFVAKLHFDIGAWMSSEMGAQMFADARKLAFTDAPKGSCGQDSIVWPPGQYMDRPALYMRFHTLIDLMPFIFFFLGMPDLAFMVMLAEKAGGAVDHVSVLYSLACTYCRSSLFIPLCRLSACADVHVRRHHDRAAQDALSGQCGALVTLLAPHAPQAAAVLLLVAAPRRSSARWLRRGAWGGNAADWVAGVRRAASQPREARAQAGGVEEGVTCAF